MSAFDDLFDRVVVVNLDRRPDRMALVVAQLDALRVSYRRFAAVDGRGAPVTQAWRAYAAQPLQLPPAAAPVRSYRDFYLGDRSTATATGPSGASLIGPPGRWRNASWDEFVNSDCRPDATGPSPGNQHVGPRRVEPAAPPE